MKNFYLIITYVLVVKLSDVLSKNDDMSKQDNDINCGNYLCSYGKGECYNNNTNLLCICKDQFSTLPNSNSTTLCDYKRKKQAIAFILESIVTYGAGHFYCENYQFAVPKLFFWVISYCLFIFLKNVAKSGEQQNTTVFVVSLIACLFLTVMFAWQLADMIMYGMNLYKDGNGIELLSWNAKGFE
jgi:hypothetical protein